MAVNRGKQFEDKVREAFERMPDVSVTRLIDPQNGYAGVRNICDYIVYRYPVQYFIECKSCHGNTLSIHSNDPKRAYGAITNNQWEGLEEKSKIPGVVAGYMIWFIDHDTTCFIPAHLMRKLRDAGHKSVNYYTFPLDLDGEWVYIRGEKKRVLFEYDMTSFFNEINENLSHWIKEE